MRVTVTRPDASRRPSSRCTPPVPERARRITSLAKKLRRGLPKRTASTRCCTLANNASANPGAGAGMRCLRARRFIPIMGMINPILGTSNRPFRYELRFVALVDEELADKTLRVSLCPTTSRYRRAIVVAGPGELDNGRRTARREAIVDGCGNRDETELAGSVGLERQVSGLELVEGGRVPHVGGDDPPLPAERRLGSRARSLHRRAELYAAGLLSVNVRI